MTSVVDIDENDDENRWIRCKIPSKCRFTAGRTVSYEDRETINLVFDGGISVLMFLSVHRSTQTRSRYLVGRKALTRCTKVAPFKITLIRLIEQGGERVGLLSEIQGYGTLPVGQHEAS